MIPAPMTATSTASGSGSAWTTGVASEIIGMGGFYVATIGK